MSHSNDRNAEHERASLSALMLSPKQIAEDTTDHPYVSNEWSQVNDQGGTTQQKHDDRK